MLRNVAVFFACAIAIAGGVNGYYAFLADASGLHGFESGMPRFVMGMTRWGIVVVGNTVGFAFAMYLSKRQNPQHAESHNVPLSATMGVLSLVAIPALIYGRRFLGAYHLGVPGEVAYLGGGALIVTCLLSLFAIHYVEMRRRLQRM